MLEFSSQFYNIFNPGVLIKKPSEYVSLFYFLILELYLASSELTPDSVQGSILGRHRYMPVYMVYIVFGMEPSLITCKLSIQPAVLSLWPTAWVIGDKAEARTVRQLVTCHTKVGGSTGV